MELIKALQQLNKKSLSEFPHIEYSNLFKKVFNNFYFEFLIDNNKYLYSPMYSQVRGENLLELNEYVTQNESFLDIFKEYIINSIFVYSAIIEENSYYLTNPQSIIISRMIFTKIDTFEIKFYTHYEDELLNSYDDKIYIGRIFINLKRFDQPFFGLVEIFNSLIDQNKKIQDRAKQKIRYYNDYKKEYLDEIHYMINETVSEALERIQLFPKGKIVDMGKIKLLEISDGLLYIQNLMTELLDFTAEFENKLRQREEKNFVRYLTKFAKDLSNDYRYLKKITLQIHLKISNHCFC